MTSNDGPFGVALNGLQAASSHEAVAHCGGLLASELGFMRYFFIEVRGGETAAAHKVFHNAPVGTSDDPALIDLLAGDLVVARARRQRIPFAWGASGHMDGGEFVARYSSLGYRCGLAASAWDRRSAGCIVAVASSAEALPCPDLIGASAFLALAASALLATLQRLRALETGGPLTERELACLLYVLAGLSAQDTANALKLTTRAVNHCLEMARTKLEVRTSYAAATIAIRRGWLDMERAIELADSAVPAPAGARNA